MEVVAPGPAVLVVDRDPEVAVDRMVAARRDHGEAGHHPGRDAPVVVAVLGVAPRADIEPARLLHDLEIRLHVGEVVFVALGALEQRIGAEVAAMQERDVAGIDAALHGLQPVAFLQALGDEGLLGGDGGEFPFRQRRLLLGRAHIGPQHRPALHQRVGLELDLLAEAALARLGGDVDALPGHVVFPAVIGAAQARLPRCGRTRATRRGGRRIRRSIRTCRRCRGRRAAAPTGSSPAPAGNRSPAAPRPAAPAANRRGTAGPSAVPGPVCVSRSFCSLRSIGSIRDRSGIGVADPQVPLCGTQFGVRSAFGDARQRVRIQQHSQPTPSIATSAFFIQAGGRSSRTTSATGLNTLN